MKKSIAILSVIVGGLTYLYMLIAIMRNGGEGLSLSTFALAAALAWITGLTMLKQKANPAVPLIYAVGASATAISLLANGRCGWSTFDSFIAALVAICAIVWLTSGPKLALILSITASVISFIPYLAMTWRQPEASPIVANVGFLLANILAFSSAKTWTLADRLYFTVNIVLCTLLVLPWFLM